MPSDPVDEALKKFEEGLKLVMTDLFESLGRVSLVEDRIRPICESLRKELTPSDSTKLANYRALEPYGQPTSPYNCVVIADDCCDRRVALYEQLLLANDISSARVYSCPYQRLDETWNSRVSLQHVTGVLCLDKILADLEPSAQPGVTSKPSRAVVVDGCNLYWLRMLDDAYAYWKAKEANVLLIVSYGGQAAPPGLDIQCADHVLVPTKYAAWDQVKTVAWAMGLGIRCKALCKDDDTDGTRTLAQLEDGNYLAFVKGFKGSKLMRHCI